ncbi:VOC family protein [Falsiroseomonas sp. E2-1-a20]|uniref:VOC family protein n=1 Tax=Falsiroseomonas sp. E2-1-a20 TaxID=3239300 RepID=UPI003F3936B4
MAGRALMLDHVSIAVVDLARAARFYDAVMAALGQPCVWREERAIGYGLRDAGSYLTIRAGATAADAACHWAFRAKGRAAVRDFHAAGLAAGGTDDGAPGLRPIYHPHYYAAFLRDPDGNRIEAVFHGPEA